MAPVISGVGGAFGRFGTSSIHFPDASVEYVFALFAFQSAFVSVESVKQPTETSLRTAHGSSASAHAPRQSTGAIQTRRRQRTYAATTSGSTSSRVLERIAAASTTPSPIATARIRPAVRSAASNVR